MMKTLLLVAATASLMASLAGVGGNAASLRPTIGGLASPLALYWALVRTPLTARELPRGFVARALPSVTRGGPRRAIGEVGFRIDGPAYRSARTIDVIVYGVLPTDQDAVAVFAAGPQAVLDRRDHRVTGEHATRLLGRSARIVTVQVTNVDGSGGRGVAGYTYCSVRVGSIIVTGGSGVIGAWTDGDTSTAIALTRAAVAHLYAAQTLARSGAISSLAIVAAHDNVRGPCGARYTAARRKRTCGTSYMAAASDVVRVAQWLDAIPLAKARQASFVELMNPRPAAA